MASASKEITGIIIHSQPSGERFVRWELISAAEGFSAITCPAKMAMPFGLFDRVELVATARGKNLFLKEARLLTRPEGLVKNLSALTEASRLANLIRKVFSHMPDYAPVYEIFEKALENYATFEPRSGRNTVAVGQQAHGAENIVTLKAFYKMLAAEGFPVKEDWLMGLYKEQFTQAQAALQAPVENLPPDINAEALVLSLIAWAGRELGVRVG